MARLVTFAALALVLATLSRAQGMMDGPYCPTAASPSAVSDMAVLVNGGYMTVLEHLGTDAYNNCGRLLRYTTDATGNVTLNELRGSSDCSSSYRLLISAMWFENATQTISAVMTYDSTSTVYNVSLSAAACTTQAASTQQLNAGKYCGAFQDSIVAYGKAMLWVTSTCVYSGKYYISGGFNQSTYGFGFTGYQSYVSTSYCFAGGSTGSQWPDTNYVNYWPASGELSVVYSTPRTISLLSTANCLASTPTLEMPINSSYCINAPGNPNYNGASLVRVNATSYFLTLPNANFYPGTTTCVFTGNVMIQGSSLGLTVSSYCSSTQQIVYAKLMADKTIMLIDQNNNYFWATPCPQTGVPNGAYCAGWNARMLVANATFQLWTDSYTNDGAMNTAMPTQTSIYFAGQFIPQADNSSLINTGTLYTAGGSYSQILSVNVMGSTVYVVVQRSSGSIVEGYAFQTDFCATSGVMGNGTNASWIVAPTPGVPAAWLPDTMTCATLMGADLTLKSSMGTVSWIWNNSWVPGVCGYVGYASHRMGQVSYRIMFQSCSQGTAPMSYTSTPTIWRNVVFNNGSLTYVLSNSSANATVMTGMCPMASNNSLPESHYCTNSRTSQLWVNGSNVLYVDSSAPCMALLVVQGVGADGTVSMQRTSGLYCPTVFTSSTYSPKVQMLPSGDLYLLGSGYSYSSTGSLWSSAVCGTNYTQPQVTAVGTYCGKFADGSKLSLIIEPVYQSLTAVLEVAGSTNVCYYKSAVDLYTLDMAVSPTMYCTGSNYYLAQITREATTSAITVFVQQYYSGNYMNVTLTANTCGQWETGLESGQYCTPIGWTETPGVLVFGSYVYFPSTNGMYVANYSILPGTTNVSVTPGSIYGWVTSGSTTSVGDVYINTMGTAPNASTLWVSSYGAQWSTPATPWSIAASRNGCPWSWNMNLTENIALASAPLPATPFNSMRVMAVFHYQGNFTMLLPSNSTSVNQRCYVYGTYQVVPGPAPQAVSFQVMGTAQGTCNYPFEISQGQWSGSAAAPVVSFALWYGWNATENVTLSTTECLSSGTIQSGRYCDGQGNFVYTCNGDVLSFAAPLSTPLSYGNVTLNTNGSMTFYESGDPMATLLQYNMSSRTVWSSTWYSQGVGYLSANMCALPPMAQDLAMPTVGMYCGSGSIAGTNATAFVLPNGNFYMTLYTLQPNSSSYNSGMCEIIGMLGWSMSTGYAQYSAMYRSTNCRFGTYSDSAPRVRINETWYNNASGVITLRGSTWTGPGGEGMDITYTLSAGSSCIALSQSTNASLVYYPRGVYGVNGAGLNVTTLVLGTTYAMYGYNAYASAPVGVLGGNYAPGTLSAARTSAGLTATFANPQFQTYVTNSTFVPGYLQASPRWAYASSSSGGHLALPMGYWGLDPASGGNAMPPGPNGPGTNGNAPGDDDKKNNTPIIVGVIVAVVVVVAIIAVIAMRMKSSGSAPKKEADHYTSMNAV